VAKKHIIFTEEFCQPSQLYPFSLTRQIQDIRVGLFSIREKWERYLKQPSLDKARDDYKDHANSVQLSQIRKGDTWILLHANSLPTTALVSAVKKMQPGDCLLDNQGGPIAYCITDKQVDSKHQIIKIKFQKFSFLGI
jgi:hypothetical protein